MNQQTTATPALDPISLEVLRNRLLAIAEDAAATVDRTSVSPMITEAHDSGVTLLDGNGNLLAAGGWVKAHWVASTRAVRATIERHGDSIAPGDVFLANDPYNGGGLHPNDVVVERPIFIDGQRVAWVVLSAHMMDFGGMAIGTFAPAAIESYQEAFRVPPVRLFKAGVEATEMWDLIRANVRFAPLIEMDLRGLVAGAHVADEKIAALIDTLGLPSFRDGVLALQQLSERALRARIAAMADGVYRVHSWAEWDDELYDIPIALTIDGDKMLFDFEGASPQAPHYFNSQPYIIKSLMIMQFTPLLAPDLPHTEGLMAPIELRCPVGSIVNARPPAPNNGGHVQVAMTAAEAMMQCVRHALWASYPSAPASRFVSGWGGSPAMSAATWAATDHAGRSSIWAMADASVGAGAGIDHDGPDLGVSPIGMESPPTATDIEVLESWYPILITERRIRPGVNGVGTYRAGGGAQIKVQPYNTSSLKGQMIGIREWLPLEGAAGGFPGATTRFLIERADGSSERISNKAADVILRQGETFVTRCASGGGVGDPLDRRTEVVGEDVAAGRITRTEAEAVYGVMLRENGTPDEALTEARRSEIRRDRLARAMPPLHALTKTDVAGLGTGETMPLYPGVVHRGPVAFAARSGTPLAIAPSHWTDGCAVLEERQTGPGPTVVIRAYLDPCTGHSLYVEAVPDGKPRSFAILPSRWTSLGAA